MCRQILVCRHLFGTEGSVLRPYCSKFYVQLHLHAPSTSENTFFMSIQFELK